MLLATARRRAAGRRARARAILRSRNERAGGFLPGFGSFLSLILAIGLSVLSALLVQGAVRAGQHIDLARAEHVLAWEDAGYGTDASGLANLQPGGAGALLGLVALAWWAAMLVLQGEGLELDAMRRRHPMWEWVLSHPVRTGALFCAEMLAPLAANPVFWGAPLMPGMLFGFVYGPGLGVVAAFIVGIPVAVAAGCLGKALEIAAMLRLSPRSRGAVFGVMGWLGTSAMGLTFVAYLYIDTIAAALAGPLATAGALPWPWLGLILGLGSGSPRFLAGALICCLLAVAVAGLAVAFSVWGAMRGLGGRPDRLAPAHLARPHLARPHLARPHLARPRPAARRRTRFGRDPTYRKEWLWFARDRSALVQAVLMPLTLAGVQVFNLRGLIAGEHGDWNAVCGAAIMFGTYFLVVLGPKSLASEGPALWIAMTWPRGLESLLRAKARLWTLVSSGFVAAPMLYAAWRYPVDCPGIIAVGLGWILFGYGMALKTVTLVSLAGASGEAEKISASRRWATTLGTFTFSIGVLSGQWPVAASGIVYSSVAGAALWQNFRARLPYLFDPWSERLPDPPTLLHAMVAIAALVEGGAVITGIVQAFAGAQWAMAARASGYALAAALVGLGVLNFLYRRGVPAAEVWHWNAAGRAPPRADRRRLFLLLALGGIAGALLGGMAHLYLLGLRHFAWSRAILDQPDPRTVLPYFRQWSFVLAVCVAPPAEEFLFRGLLYRALDREWGGWPAIAGSAAFFAIYHPVLSWLPVGLLGACNAILFRRAGTLAPAVLLHMAYNAVVVL